MPKKGYNLDKLQSVVQRLLTIETTPETSLLSELKTELNTFFDESTCVDLIYTNNTDNVFFGINFMPIISNEEVIDIITTDNDFPIRQYYLELDSKMISLGLTAEQYTAYLLTEIGNFVIGCAPVKKFKDTLAAYFMEHNDILSLKDSTQYSQILGFAIKDTLIKQNSIAYMSNEQALSNDFIVSCGYDNDLKYCLSRISSSAYGEGESVKNQPLVILEWALRLYKNVKENRIPAIKVLKRSTVVTGSSLNKREFAKVIAALQKIDTDLLQEAAFLMESAKKKNSLFKQLKSNGLRAIEDDLYEFRVRIKNAETEDEVMYTLRQINTRLTILSDYLDNEELSEDEYDRWHDVLTSYRNLREELAKKKVYNKKNYGLWYSYNQMDQDDRDQSMY